jgi:hypothetical protein
MPSVLGRFFHFCTGQQQQNTASCFVVLCLKIYVFLFKIQSRFQKNAKKNFTKIKIENPIKNHRKRSQIKNYKKILNSTRKSLTDAAKTTKHKIILFML